MKTLISLFAAFPGFALAAAPADPGNTPEGLTASEWSEIRAVHDAARHAVLREDDGDLLARNPGQEWSTEFDGRGFTVTPDHGAWTWGLELTGYGEHTLPSPVSPFQLRHEGGKITFQRDANLTEWFVNDSRGLEQGWNLQQRPDRADPAAPLQLHLTSRGNVRPQVSAGGDSVSFQQENGGSALSYGGLKAWDADGKKLAVHFEQAGGNGIRIAVDDQSARYPITIDPVAQQTSLSNYNLTYSNFAVSGDTVVLGAPFQMSATTGVGGDSTNTAAPGSGAVYVYTRNGTAWTLQAFVKASNTAENDVFGTSVAISGDTLVVGAEGEDSAATGVNGDQTSNAASYSGAVYVFTRSGGVWSQQAYLKASNAAEGDAFGTSVAISGDTLVVGAAGEDSTATGVNGDQSNNAGTATGAAYVFTRTGTTWSQQAYLKASNPQSLDSFADAVAVSGDTVVVGAYQEDSNATGVNGNQADNSKSNAGAAYVYHRSGTTWTQEAYLKAIGTNPGSWFGATVGVSGDTVVVGAPINSGAFVYVRNGGAWTYQASLRSIDYHSSDNFGTSVAISGESIVVGAVNEDSGATGLNGDAANNFGNDSGAAYLFTRSGTTWTQRVYIKANQTSAWASFGKVAAISGGTVVVGNGTWLNIIDLFTSGSEIDIEQAGTAIASGGTKTFSPIPTGLSSELTFTLSNLATEELLLTGTPKVSLIGSSDFTVTAQPDSPVAGNWGSTSFKVRFAPTSDGTKTATLSIASNDANEGTFLLNLSGPVLSFNADTDGDGLSDASEYNMSALNFNWQLKQTALVNTYFTDVNRTGLYAASQVQALRPGKKSSITRNAATGRIKLTMDWQQSLDLANFFKFTPPAGSSVSINPSGGIDFEFTTPDSAVFFRIDE